MVCSADFRQIPDRISKGKKMGDNKKHWVGFNRVQGIGPVRLNLLLKAFGSVEQAWTAPETALRGAGLDAGSLRNMIEVRSSIDLDAEWAVLREKGIQVLTIQDARYPGKLREINGAPIVLYVWGELREEDEQGAAIVGTRRLTAYGRSVTREIATTLATWGVTVISGMARGIDAEAHQAALDAGGRSIAVLGSGLDHLYPPEHRKMAQQISESGAVITDYPLGTRPEGQNFPPRNRIISGLANVVIVIEAGDKSGALITAGFAADQGKEVLAVPGRISDRASKGTNRLIQTGAHPLLSSEDVLEVLNLEQLASARTAKPPLPKDALERKVLEALSSEPTHVDELQARCHLPVAQITSTLTVLELRGQARQVGGMQYIRVREQGADYTVG
jgi:DNA processing protein